MGEAARAVGVEPYVLRFWETQFPILRPRHSRSKHRFYETRDIETLRLIKRLLHTEGFTIAGARKHIREVGLERLRAGADSQKSATPPINGAPASPAAPTESVQRRLAEIRDDLISLRNLLENNGGR
ncbi:MAG: MerR family transcriptional regulator [Candidatus Binataceae bacterium]